jgi:DNA-binding response OmpR family regulator
MDHVGKIMSRDQILDQIRNREWVSTDRTVDVLIGRLRRKLGDDSAAPRLILTVHGAGYLFTPKLVNLV